MSQHMACLIQSKISIDYLLSSLNKNFSPGFASQKKIGLDWSMHSLGLLVNHARMSEKPSNEQRKGLKFFSKCRLLFDIFWFIILNKTILNSRRDQDINNLWGLRIS